MARINDGFLQLPESYLFVEIARRVKAFSSAHPDADIIRLGIGDVTLPLAIAVTDEMAKASHELSVKETFKGYGPEKGYAFLIDRIVETDYQARNIPVTADDIFISDGAKSDCGNIGNLFDSSCTVLVPEPAYPVYVDSSLMDGKEVTFLPGKPENGFVPVPPKEKYDVVFLCSPNNPTGFVMNREQIKVWVDYARKNRSVLIFDSAYEAYISDPSLPHSVYEVEGARECAIEIRSFSKLAGFTGVRCGYTVVPTDLMGEDENGNPISLNKLWNRRQSTKFNGASYLSQRGACAVYTANGREQCKALVAYYMENAKVMREALDTLGIPYTGGSDSPYVWLKCPNGMSSWEFFDFLLEKANIVGTPGSGFGKAGEGWFRLTAFGDKNRTQEAVARLKEVLK